MNPKNKNKAKNISNRTCLVLIPILLACGCVCPHNIFEQLLISTPTSTTTIPVEITLIENPIDEPVITSTTTTTTQTRTIVTTTTSTTTPGTGISSLGSSTTTSTSSTTTTTKKTTTTLKNISCYDVRNPSPSNCEGAICPSGGTCKYRPGGAGCCGMPPACYCN